MNQPALPRAYARKLANEHVQRGDITGWFERLYADADGHPGIIPWADQRVNPNLEDWLNRRSTNGAGRSALVVGCGLGDDAEALAARQFKVTAFDISPTAIEWCRRRFPESDVAYHVADLFDLPHDWALAFDFVVEAYTLQVIPASSRRDAYQRIAGCVAPGGQLLVITRGRDPGNPVGEMPWPLTKEELLASDLDLSLEGEVEDYFDEESPPVRRLRALFVRKGGLQAPAR